MTMPYECSSDDGQPVVVHLQQLEDPYEQVDFCQTCWVSFIVSSGLALGLVENGVGETGPDASTGLVTTGQDGPEEAQDGTEPAEGVPVPVGAFTEDQRPDADDPAPY